MPKVMAEYSKTEGMASIGSTILGVLEVQALDN